MAERFIELACQCRETDRLEVAYDDLGPDRPMLRFFLRTEDTTTAYLDTEQVRELLNFMGVWLHTQAGG